nr:hypothetical protein [Tanacetum cinerariifolium]
MDLFNLICVPNPTKVKVGSRPRAPHEVPLLTLTAPRVIEIDEPTATDSSSVLSIIERSPLDFAHEAEASDQGAAAPEIPSSEDVPTTVASGVGQVEEAAIMDPPTAPELPWGKSLAAMQLGLASSVVPEDAPVGISDPDPVSFADAPSRHPADVAQSSQGIAAAGDPGSENVSSSGLRGVCTVRNGYNINLARQVAMGSQLRLRFEQEAKLLRKSVAQVARRDQRIQARESKIKNLEARLETKAGMKRPRKTREQVSGEEKLKVAFEEFKRYEDERVEQRCAKLDARLDALSIDFDEELYPHMLTTIAGRRQAFADVVSAGVAKGLKDAPMDVIMVALYLESDTREDAPQYIRDLRPSSSQLTIPVSDGIPVSVPTVVPQGLALLLVEAATQTDLEDLVL